MAVPSAVAEGSGAAADHASGRRSARGGLVFLLLVAPSVLVLLLIGVFPSWGYSRSWGYRPVGGLGVILVIVIILLLMHVI